MDIILGDQNPVENQQSIIVFTLKKLEKEFVWIRIQFNAKMHVFIGIYSVFRGSVDHGGGCVDIYIYIDIDRQIQIHIYAYTYIYIHT